MSNHKSYQIINPYSLELIEKYSFENIESCQKKIQQIYKGKKQFIALSAQQRYQLLAKFSELISQNRDQLALQITKETGKTLTDSTIEMTRAADTILCSAEETKRIDGEVIDGDSWGAVRMKVAHSIYRPIGIVLAITPFNFPINLALHKIGPALAAGNTVLFKPHEQCLGSARLLVELARSAGITEDYLQTIIPHVGDMPTIIKDSRIDCISLTGGPHAAKAIMKDAGIKKVLLELGGNDPLIVMNDAELERAAEIAINQRFGTAGQRCTAPKRVFVHSDVYDQFKELVVSKTKKLKVGNPLEPDTYVGPVINGPAADEIMKRLESAIAKGAKVLTGNKRQGNLIYPTVIENVAKDADLICQETFGPVIPLIPFNDIEEVISAVNESPYGLQAGIFTRDIKLIKKLHLELEVGALVVDDGPGYRAEHLPFGGVKLSGLGREGVKYAIREMSVVRTLIF